MFLVQEWLARAQNLPNVATLKRSRVTSLRAVAIRTLVRLLHVVNLYIRKGILPLVL